MEKDILSQVIEAEKEIQKCLKIEKNKAREWLEGVKKESEAEFLREERRIRESLELTQAESAKEADRQAAEIVQQAARAAERLGQLGTGTLQRLIEKRLTEILPG